MAKKIRKLLGVLFILTAIIITQIPAQEAMASVAKEDYLMDKDILSKYTGTATTVSVSDDVKIIGEEAFAGNQYIGNVNLGKNVEIIKHGAFANCNYINRIVIPDSVETIESAAFSGCSNLTGVQIGSNVEKLGEGVFAGCINLTSISMPKSNDNFTYQAGVLYDDKIEHIYTYLCGNTFDSYSMPNSVNNISTYSFWGNENLSEIYLSSNLEAVPGYAFSNCKNLKSVQIPYSVNSIDAKAFENCVSLTDVEIPPTVTYIDPTAFDGCPKLNIIAQAGSEAEKYWENYQLNDVTNAESQDAKYLVNQITDEVINTNENTVSNTTDNGLIDASKDPSNVDWMPSVNPLISSEDPSLFGKTIVVSGRAVFFINKDMEVKQLDKADIIENDTTLLNSDSENTDSDESVLYDSGKGGYIPKYTFNDGIVASQAFYASKSSDLDIPAGTKEIGRFAYARSAISSITIPDGVEKIDYGAFYHCDNLIDVIIPGSVKKIEGYAFDNTLYLEKFKSEQGSEHFLIVGDGILLAYNGNDSVVNIPEGVKLIAPGCFYGCTGISAIIIPDTCESIGSDAFRDCTSLKSVTGGNNLKEINDRAFMNCPVSGMMIPSSVTKVGLKAFDFSNTDLKDEEKVIVIPGNELPSIMFDDTSSRLSNDNYRQDTLYNVLYVVVNDGIDDFSGTILDEKHLGFSGMILSYDKDSDGVKTGKLNIVDNYIYSQDILDSLSGYVMINGSKYDINGYESVDRATSNRNKKELSKNISVLYNGNINENYSARLSQSECLGYMYINDSQEAKSELEAAYHELFGESSIDLRAYDIKLMDQTETLSINRMGKSVLYITVPIDSGFERYHAISLDEDGQLEELPAVVNEQENTITFQTSHLSYFGIYGMNGDNVTLNIRDGQIVKNYRLDSSPETGDNSFPIKYIYAVAFFSIGIILILIKGKKKNNIA